MDDFGELISRIRRGDADAAREIVRRYEMSIRVAVRTRLSDPRLRRHFDSMDVCQSVLASFFLRVASGAYDLDDPRQLVSLLMKMAEKKLAMRRGRIAGNVATIAARPRKRLSVPRLPRRRPTPLVMRSARSSWAGHSV